MLARRSAVPSAASSSLFYLFLQFGGSQDLGLPFFSLMNNQSSKECPTVPGFHSCPRANPSELHAGFWTGFCRAQCCQRDSCVQDKEAQKSPWLCSRLDLSRVWNGFLKTLAWFFSSPNNRLPHLHGISHSSYSLSNKILSHVSCMTTNCCMFEGAFLNQKSHVLLRRASVGHRVFLKVKNHVILPYHFPGPRCLPKITQGCT